MTDAGNDHPDNKPRLTIELLCYGLSFGLALALRLLALDRWPLLDGEASLALAAWRVARGLPATLRGHSPLLFHVDTLLFYLTNGSDALARSFSVLCGAALVLVPYALRQRLGRLGALVASFLLAISPSLVYFSRVADGSIAVAFCALGLLAAVVGYLDERRPACILAAAVLAVFALLSGPSVYTWITLLLTFVLVLYLLSRRSQDRGVWDELGQAWRDLGADAETRRLALLLAALVFLVAGVAFLSDPAGLQMALDQFGQWVRGFQWLRSVSPAAGLRSVPPAAGLRGTPWYRGLQLLLLYETLPLVLGLAWFFVTRKRHDLLTQFLRYAFVFTLVFSIVPGYRPANGVLLILLPLVLAAGQTAEIAFEKMAEGVRQPAFWALVALNLVMAAAAYEQLVVYLVVPTSTYLLRIAALVVFAVAAHAMLWSLSGPRIPLRAAAFSLVLLLLFVTLRTEAHLNYTAARDPVEPLVGTTTSPDVLELARWSRKLSSQLKGDPRIMDWQVDASLETPLGWYLRSFESVSYLSAASAVPDASGVILPSTAEAPARYVGMRFVLHSTWTSEKPPLLEWVRWWTGYQNKLKEQPADEVMLWVKSEPQGSVE